LGKGEKTVVNHRLHAGTPNLGLGYEAQINAGCVCANQESVGFARTGHLCGNTAALSIAHEEKKLLVTTDVADPEVEFDCLIANWEATGSLGISSDLGIAFERERDGDCRDAIDLDGAVFLHREKAMGVTSLKLTALELAGFERPVAGPVQRGCDIDTLR